MSAKSWGLFGLFGALFAFAIAPATDPDLGWHLATGRWIADNKTIPLTDPFSWSVPGRKWIAHEWLAEVLMYSLRRIGGDSLLILVWAALVTASWVVLYRTALHCGARTVPSAVITSVGAVSTFHTWGVRPQMVTLFLVALTGMQLQKWRHGGRVPLELVPLVALWVNLHGGYIFGIVMVWIFAGGATADRLLRRNSAEQKRPLPAMWGLALGCLAASIANPNTVDGLIYPFTYLGDNASTRYVGEWFQPDFTRPMFWPFLIFLAVLVFAAVQAVRHRTWSLIDVGLTVPFVYLALQSTRNMSQLVVCATPFAAALLSQAISKDKTASQQTRTTRQDSAKQVTATHQSWMSAIAAVLIVGTMLFATRGDLSQQENTARRSLDYPLTATKWLKTHPGKVFNHYNYGGWLILNNIPVYVDGRPDMYGDEFMERYVEHTAQSSVQNWQQTMAELGVTQVLMPRISAMAKQIDKDITAGRAERWSEPVDDQTARLFVYDAG